MLSIWVFPRGSRLTSRCPFVKFPSVPASSSPADPVPCPAGKPQGVAELQGCHPSPSHCLGAFLGLLPPSCPALGACSALPSMGWVLLG